MTRSNLIRLMAWGSLAAIVFVTVAPIEFRPPDPLPVELDRALAFSLVTFLFALAYPRHLVLVAALLVASAGAIELLQELSPTRHAHVSDATVKALGAAFGAALGWIVTRTATVLRPSTASRR